MAKSNNNLNAVFTDTANAIRGKTGSSAPITPRDFADEINNISVGGGDDLWASIVDGSIGEINDVNGEVHYVAGNTFQGKPNLKMVSFPACISVGLNAFYQASKLEEVYLPNCLSMSSSAFYYCRELKNINAPNCLFLGYGNQFAGCSKLQNVYFPNLSGISAFTFYSCLNISYVNFPLVFSIDSHAFNNCWGLLEAYFPLATYLGSAAFATCGSLSSVSFSPLLGIIGSGAFSQCDLRDVSFSMVSLVNQYAFRLNKNLSKCSFPNGDMIGQMAFDGCSSLSAIEFMNVSVPVLQNANAFQNTPMSDSSYLGHFGSIYVPSAAVASYKTATNWVTYSDRITALDSTWDKKCVYAYEFYNRNDLTAIPSEKLNAEMIGQLAFYGCSALSNKVSFPSCSVIGAYAFAQLSNIHELSLPNVKVVGGYAFQVLNKSALTELNLPECVHIGQWAFASQRGLSVVNLPKLKDLFNMAFGGCTNLSSLSIPECVYIGTGAFLSCTVLGQLSIPACLFVDEAAFQQCVNLSDVTAPNVKCIQRRGFASCFSITQLSFPELLYVSDNAFNKCTSLESFYAPALLELQGSAFMSCGSLTNFNAPNLFAITGAETFAYCTNLMQIVFPKLYTMGGLSFGSRTFAKCTKLESVYLLSNKVVQANYSDHFDSTPITDSSYLGHYGSIYVRASLLSQYQNHSIWGALSDRFVGLTDQEVQQVLDHFND